MGVRAATQLLPRLLLLLLLLRLMRVGVGWGVVRCCCRVLLLVG